MSRRRGIALVAISILVVTAIPVVAYGAVVKWHTSPCKFYSTYTTGGSDGENWEPPRVMAWNDTNFTNPLAKDCEQVRAYMSYTEVVTGKVKDVLGVARTTYSDAQAPVPAILKVGLVRAKENNAWYPWRNVK